MNEIELAELTDRVEFTFGEAPGYYLVPPDLGMITREVELVNQELERRGSKARVTIATLTNFVGLTTNPLD